MSDDTATIETTKGTHTGTIRSCVAWQREMQGAMATLVVGDLRVDVDGIDYGAESVEADIAATLAAIEAAR